MSVIRRPEVLGRTTQRRLVGATAAIAAALVETLAVGSWFLLVAGSRTLSTTMAALGILFCGSLLRTSVFGAATRRLVDVLQPRRLVAACTLTASWLVWLLVAERVGIGVAAVVLVGVLTGQFALERRVFRVERESPSEPIVALTRLLLPGTLLGVGATSLLSAAWLVDWTITVSTFSLESTTLLLEVSAIHVGVVVFGLASCLAQQRRFHHLL